MRRRIILFICLIACLHSSLLAQELEARISINTSRLSLQSDKKAFQTLQSALNTFLNNRKWTNESFETNEKIQCNFLLNVSEADDGNIYKAALTVQAARPIFNSSYESPLINFIDEAVAFHYVEYQPIDFNENRVSGTDPLASNLTALFAYYVYLILALEVDSFSLKGGDPYYQKALMIVNKAPEGRDISGWKSFDGLRNRDWLIENLTNNRFTQIHDASYNYYRLGLDFMYDKEVDGRNSVMNTLSIMNTINNDNPNSMCVQFFFVGKATEMFNIFKKGSPDEKQRARDILSKIDISNANLYKQE